GGGRGLAGSAHRRRNHVPSGRAGAGAPRVDLGDRGRDPPHRAGGGGRRGTPPFPHGAPESSNPPPPPPDAKPIPLVKKSDKPPETLRASRPSLSPAAEGQAIAALAQAVSELSPESAGEVIELQDAD